VDIQCSARVGRNLVRFIYTEEMEEDVLKEEAEVFLELGEMYGMETLKKMAEEAMVETLNMENMVRFLLAGDLYRAWRVRERAKELLKLNLRKLREREHWQELFGGRKDLIIELLLEHSV